MVKENLQDVFKQLYKTHFIPTISDFIKIKNTSRKFDHDQTLQNTAIQYLINWTNKLELQNLTILKLSEENKTPALVIAVDAPGTKPSIMFYGHLDKQPGMDSEWSENLSPYEPSQNNNKLFGRGSSEGVQSFVSSILMIKALQSCSVDHNRFVLFYETDQNSGSQDAFYYFKKHQYFIQKPEIIYCLDFSVPDYNSLYCVKSLKGYVDFDLKVQVGRIGVHSGMGGGLVPDSYRIGAQMLDQFQNTQTGELPKDFYDQMPQEYENNLKDFMTKKENKLNYNVKFVDGYEPETQNAFELFKESVWDPSLCCISMDNVPTLLGGNVLRAYTTWRFNLATPPTFQGKDSMSKVKDFFMKLQPLYNAKVECNVQESVSGFYDNQQNKNLSEIIQKASKSVFGQNCQLWATGESNQFLAQMKNYFKDDVMFVLSGLKSFDSNSRCPDENLNLDYAEKALCCLLTVVNDASNL